MANQIRLKRASGSDPSASDLVTGELAVRTDTAKLFTKKDDNSVAEIGGGITDVVDDTSPQLGGNLDANSKAILLGDSTGTLDSTSEDVNRLCVGAGRDFQIVHNGNDTYLNQVGTGSLYLRSVATNEDIVVQAGAGGDVKLRTNAGEDAVIATTNADVALYYDNSKKFFTISNGVQATNRIIVGESTNQRGILSGDASSVSVGSISDIPLNFNRNNATKAKIDGDDFQIPNDSGKIELGAGQDLQIYHNGTNSYINNATGALAITGDDLNFENAARDETYIECDNGGAVKLYYDNSKKLETTSGGIDVDGSITCDDIVTAGALLHEGDTNTLVHFDANDQISLKTNGSTRLQVVNTGINVTGNIELSTHLDMPDDAKIKLGTGDDLEIYHNGSDSFIAETGTGQLKISGSAGVHIMKHDHVEVMASFYHDAACEFYYNNVKKIETTASGVAITGNATSSVSSLTDGATITVDFSSATHFTVTLGGNRTFGDPGSTSNAIGSSGSIFIIQDGTGSRTASFHGDYKFAGGTAPTLSTAANAVDRLDYVVRASDNIHCVVTLDVK